MVPKRRTTVSIGLRDRAHETAISPQPGEAALDDPCQASDFKRPVLPLDDLELAAVMSPQFTREFSALMAGCQSARKRDPGDWHAKRPQGAGRCPTTAGAEIGIFVGKSSILPPIGKLRHQPKLASVQQTRNQRQVHGSKDPTLTQFFRRPQSLDRIASLGLGNVRLRSRTDPGSLLGQNAQLLGDWPY